MKGKIQTTLIALALVLGLGTYATTPVGAINVIDDACTGSNAQTDVCKAQDDQAGKLVRDVINLLLFIIGVISVIMIIVGGIRYTVSDGDASNIKTAKDTILYAVVGLVVALLAYAIVNFVVGRFTTP
jgi:hypothetical protein